MQANTTSHPHDIPTKRSKPALTIAPDPAPANEQTKAVRTPEERRVDPLLMITAAGAIAFILLALAASFA